VDQKTWTIKDLLDVTSGYLRKKEIESPRLSAEILLAHQLKISRVQLYLRFDQPLHDREIAGYRSLIKRRLSREPLQYITGTQEFWSLEFNVGPEVMIPRPESELLVEQVVSLPLKGRLPEQRNPRILDLGTGSGALAIALARELEGAFILATDISGEALTLARLNAKKHGVQERIEFIQSDVWEAFQDQNPMFDVVLSNPPYIASETIDALAPEVRDYEPRVAFDGGEEGMFFIREIITEGPGHVKPGGWILLEMDPEQTTKAFTLIEKGKYYGEKIRIKDYSRHYRVVMAQIISPAKL